MKKPITIGVIAVIATILVTSAVDYSAIGAKPIDQIHLQTSTSVNDGIVSCPNGDTIELDSGSISVTEHDSPAHRGNFEVSDGIATAFAVTLWSGNIQSDQFTFTGIGNESQTLAQFCDESLPIEKSLVTVWGECGQDVTVHFEAESGYSGSFTGNVLCV